MATTTTSKQFWLNARDYIRALLYAMISPVIPIVLQSIKAQTWVFDWNAIWHTAIGAGVTYLAAKFFTPTQTITTPARILILCFCLAAAAPGQAQSPFKPIPKIQTALSARNPFVRAAIVLPDSTLNSWRLIANIAAYAEPGNLLMAGVGYGYQHLKYDYTAQKWNCQWSVSAVGFAGGSVAPTTPASIASFGILGGISNNLLMAGPIYNPGTKQFGIAVSIGINLNN